MTIMRYEWMTPVMTPDAAGCKVAFDDFHSALTTKSCWEVVVTGASGEISNFDSLPYQDTTPVNFGFRIYRFKDDFQIASNAAPIYMRVEYRTINDARQTNNISSSSVKMFPYLIARIGKSYDSSGVIANAIVEAVPWNSSSNTGVVVVNQLPASKSYIYTNTEKGIFHMVFASKSRCESYDSNGNPSITNGGRHPIFVAGIERSYDLATGSTTGNGMFVASSATYSSSLTETTNAGATLTYVDFGLNTNTTDYTLGSYRGRFLAATSGGVMTYQPLCMYSTTYGVVSARSLVAYRALYRPEMTQQSVMLDGVPVNVFNQVYNKRRMPGLDQTTNTTSPPDSFVSIATLEI